MPTITPFIWFNDNAQEAMDLYISAFPDAKMVSQSPFISKISLMGQELQIMNFETKTILNPSISFFVNFKTARQVEDLYHKLKDGCKELMPLNQYPFSKKYAWLQDQFGVSWQISQSDNIDKNFINPTFLFHGDNAGRAQEAIDLYTTIFPESKVEFISKYGENAPDKAEYINYSLFQLQNQQFGVMDSSFDHQFEFNEAISFVISVNNQKDVDYYWDKLIEGGGKEIQCGWIVDQFGVSWQVVPVQLMRLIGDPDPVKSERVRQTMFKMIKIDIAGLEAAYNQE